MALKEYKLKRDLQKSKEPTVKIKSSKSKKPIFVIQKHIASHLHYDLRLEADGVLKSWAIPKGFSGGAHQKNLAIMVEDHPFDYRNFKGTIPPGNYGAGTVIIWDKGTYTIDGLEDKPAIEKEAIKRIKNGLITFILNGTKLTGEFSLVKIKPRGKENSWLLIKTKGHLNEGYTPQMQEEDKKEYVETKLKSEKIIKAPFPGRILPMLAELTSKPFDQKGWIFELKLDGYRAQARIKPDKKIELLSRNQIFLNRFPGIIKSLEAINLPCILDGEIVALDKKGKPDFHALQNYIKSGEGKIIYYVFDILYIEESDLKAVPLIKRKKILKYLISNYLPDSENVKYLDHIKDNGLDMYSAVIKNGLEGIVAKDGKSEYEPGKRTGKWLKIKSIKTQEAIIIGLTSPRGSRKYFGSLVLAAYDNKQLKYIGHSGGGFADSEMLSLKNMLKNYFIDKPPIKDLPAIKNVQWIKPKFVCQIKFAEWTPDGLMRQPVFEGLRTDKKLEDVKIEK